MLADRPHEVRILPRAIEHRVMRIQDADARGILQDTLDRPRRRHLARFEDAQVPPRATGRRSRSPMCASRR